MALTAYADADHTGCQDTRRSTSGGAQFLRDKLVSWPLKKQKSIVISTTEAEYIAMSGCYTMNDMNMPANDVPAKQAPAIAPPTRTDDQILPSSKWVPIGKSKCILNVQKSQRNPIFPIDVALLKNTNFFRAFTASSTIPVIYIQQFWDTVCFNSSNGLYNCQLDEQWFNLHKDILRDALDITPTNDDNPFVAPPSSDTVLKYVNTLGYPSTLRNVFAMSVNALYQPWRAILSMINMCLTGKTAGYDRPRHPVLQILWGIIHSSNIDYAERIWEEFVQSIQTFLTDRKNLATASRGKKKTAHLLIPSVRFTKLIIHHLKTKHNIHLITDSALHYSHEENVPNTLRYVGKDGREIFGMSIPDALLADEIKGEPYFSGYLEHVVEYQRYLDEEHDKVEEEEAATESPKATKVTKPKAAKVTKPAGDKATKPTSTQTPKPKPAPTQPSKAVLEKKQKLVKETPDEPSPAKRSKGGLVGKSRKPKSPLRLVDEPSDEGVPIDETAYNEEEANIQRALELSLQDQGERTQGPARPVVIREPDSGRLQPLPEVQGKGKEKFVEEQAVHDLLTLQTLKKKSPADQDEGQAGSNPGDAVESQPQSSHVVPAGPNLEHMDLEATDASTQQKSEQMDEEFTTTAYPNVQENLKLSTKDQFFMEKPQEEEPGKTNTEAEVQSMVSVLIHQDTSSVPPKTTPVIDLTKSQSDSPLPTSTATILTIMTTTTTLLPQPPQPQQSTAYPILVKRIGELEQHMADLIQNNLAMEKVDWAMQAPLRARFRDLPTVDMKEILQQRVFEENSYKAHDVHNDLYEALSPPSQLPPPPPPAGASGAPGNLGASGSSPLPPPPPHPSTSTSGSAQQKGSKASSSSKTAASASQYMAWTTSDTRYELGGVSGAQELSPTDSLMQDDSILDK
ncbi:retrovirus-related pol polyprotein from transposon TNT 1-94 [Tanacetum coccineum]